MLKLIAVLIVCAITLLLQGVPAGAQGSDVHRPRVESCCESGKTAETFPLEQDSCLGGASCCMVMCGPCQSQAGAYLTVVERLRLESSLVRIPDSDFIRSIVLTRDPPIPRIRSFQSL